MCPTGYYMMLRNYNDPKQLRLKLVLYADERGKKAAARRFATTVSTVRKWHGRWKIKGLAGLEEMSRRPHNCPNAISQEVRKHVIACPCWPPLFSPNASRQNSYANIKGTKPKSISSHYSTSSCLFR